MIIKGDDKLRDVSGLSETEKQRILDFLQGAVYCWCKNRKGECFSILELMGGDNRDWNGTPLQTLYDKHRLNGKDDKEAWDVAGQESGWLLKETIHRDERRFETESTAINRRYRWLEG